MIVTISGENSFGWRAELDKRVKAFVAEYGDMSVERLDGEEASLERLQESLQSLPFLSAKKLVVLRAPSGNKQFAERLEPLLASVADTTEVIIVEPKLDRRGTYYKLLKKLTTFCEFPQLDENGLARWASELAVTRGGDLSLTDARTLVARVGANQQTLSNELEKLILYKPHITKASIELLVDETPQGKIFDLLDAAFAGNMRRAIELYKDQRAQKVDHSQIIGMLAWQLRILALLLTASERTPGDVAQQAKVSPYTLQKSLVIARRIRLARLKQLIGDLLAIDVRSKRESIDLDEALQNFLLKLA